MEYNIAELLKTGEKKYVVVNALAQRIRSLQNGAKPLVPHATSDVVALAFEEFKENQLVVENKSDQPDGEKETSDPGEEGGDKKDEK